MEYRGLEYTIVQGIDRDTWRWTVWLGAFSLPTLSIRRWQLMSVVDAVDGSSTRHVIAKDVGAV
jgi:hypothetical protein